MVLAIGLVVDDAIVVLENIFRHIEEGIPRRKAAMQGAREIAFAVIAMTLTLTAVFAPLAFATGTHRAAVHRVRADAGGGGAGVGLRGADAVADDVLAAAQAREEALVALQRDRALPAGTDPRLPARAEDDARGAGADRAGMAGGGRSRRAAVHAAEVRADAVGGSRRDLRHRVLAAGLHGALHLREHAPDRGALHADSGSGGVERDLRLSDGRRRQRDPAPEAVGGTHAPAAADRRRAAAEVRPDSGRDRLPGQPARRSASRRDRRRSNT